jgi:hypothetical protein
LTATAWLKAFLKNGPRTMSEIRDESRTAHFLWSTILHARTTLGVRTISPGVWALPKEAA